MFAEEDNAGRIVQASKNYQIAHITPQANNPFFLTIEAGCKDAAAAYGVTVNYMAPKANDMQSQTTVVQAALTTKPDLMIIAPVDSEGMGGVLKEVSDLGIPIITVDRDLNDTSLRLACIQSNNYEAGQFAANTMIEMLDGKGKIAILTFNPGVQSVDDRLAGFEEVISSVDEITVVGKSYASSDLHELAAKANALITQTPDLDAIFASFTNAVLASGNMVKQAGLLGSIKVLGFDTSPDEVDMLRAGVVDALICQGAYDMGWFAVQYAVEYLESGTMPPEMTNTDLLSITSENMDKPEIAKYIYRTP